MTDTNNTDGAALLPVTPEDRETAAEIAETLLINSDIFPVLIRNGEHDNHPFVQSYARHRISHSLPGDVGTVALQNCIGSILKVIEPLLRFHETGGHEGDGSGKQLAKIRAVLRTPIGKLPAALSSPLPATQEDAERSGVDLFDIEPSLAASSPEPSLRRIVRKYYNDHFNAVRAEELTTAYFAALSTPQRQEYDGEAVREALEDLLKWADNVCNAQQFGPQKAVVRARAALTPSALSGDAGEGERLRDRLADNARTFVNIARALAEDDAELHAQTIAVCTLSAEECAAALPCHQGAGE